MYFLKKFNLIFLLIFLSFNTIVKAETVKVGLFDFPPFYINDGSKQFNGSLVKLLHEIFKKANLKYEMEMYPVKRLYLALASGEKHVFIGVKNAPEYEGKVYYSKKPVTTIKLCAFSIGETPLIHSKEDLNGKNVILVRGYSYAGLINYFKDPKNKMDLHYATAHDDGISMLRVQRAKYLVDYLDAGEEYLKKQKNIDLKCSVITTAKLHIIVSKAAPNASELFQKLEKAYAEIQTPK